MTIGLGQVYWKEVIHTLRNIIPIYDKVNKIISLGKDQDFRLIGIRNGIFSGNLVLDAGSGFGNMSKLTLNEFENKINVVMYDPIFDMLKKSKTATDLSIQRYSGIFEFLPFKSNIFDAVMCGYSMRDSIYLEQAISEMQRILKKNGRLIIVDLGKPDNRIVRAGVSFYLRYVLGIMAFLVAGKEGFRFNTLYGTFQKWPQNEKLHELLSNKFSRIVFIKKFLGAAIIIIAYK